MSDIDLAAALKQRFETESMFGVRALPVRIAPAASPFKPIGAALEQVVQSEYEVILPAPVAAEELKARRTQLQVIDQNEVKGCTRCGLHAGRTNTVFGVGPPDARIMFVGEGPGFDEDRTGEPFVGRAGQLLTAMIEKGMGLKRGDVYICNVIKCRPPDNRTPATDEIAACKDFLWRQIEIIRPQVIIALGTPAAQTLLNTREGISKLRSRWHDFYPSGSSMMGDAIPLMPTFHPAYLLRSPQEKGKAWADLKLVMARLGIPIPIAT